MRIRKWVQVQEKGKEEECEEDQIGNCPYKPIAYSATPTLSPLSL